MLFFFFFVAEDQGVHLCITCRCSWRQATAITSLREERDQLESKSVEVGKELKETRDALLETQAVSGFRMN